MPNLATPLVAQLPVVRSLRTWSIAAILVLLSTAAEPASGDDSYVEQVIAALEQATNAIRSYDVYVRCERTHLLKYLEVPGQPAGLSPKKYEFTRHLPGEKPRHRTTVTRQARSPDSKQRGEFLPLKEGDIDTVVVFNGKVVKAFSPGNNRGLIRSKIPDQKPFYSNDEFYGALYRDMLYGGTILQLLQDREKDHLLSIWEDDASGRTIIQVPTKQGSNLYPRFGWIFELDPDHGMLPVKIGVFLKLKSAERPWSEYPWSETVVTRFYECEPGIWAPLEATGRCFVRNGELEGETLLLTHLAVDLDRSRWNVKLPDEVFELDFPEDAKVRDLSNGPIHVGQ